MLAFFNLQHLPERRPPLPNKKCCEIKSAQRIFTTSKRDRGICKRHITTSRIFTNSHSLHSVPRPIRPMRLEGRLHIDFSHHNAERHDFCRRYYISRHRCTVYPHCVPGSFGCVHDTWSIQTQSKTRATGANQHLSGVSLAFGSFDNYAAPAT